MDEITELKKINERMEDKNAPREEFSKLLKEYRESRRISAKELAKKSSLSLPYINAIESRKCNPPRLKQIIPLAKALDLGSYETRKLSYARMGLLNILEPYIPKDFYDIAEEIPEKHMVWSIGRIPINFDNKWERIIYESIMYSVEKGRTNFTFWLPERRKSDFEKFISNSENELKDKEVPRGRISNLIKCVITDDIACLIPFVIYNPLDTENREEKVYVLDDNGNIFGGIIMPKSHTDKVSDFFVKAYNSLSEQSETEVESCRFKLYTSS